MIQPRACDLRGGRSSVVQGLGMSRAGTMDMGRVTGVSLTFPGSGAGTMLLQPKDSMLALLPRA